MTKKKIGLKEISALAPGQTIWDATVAGFGARRQRSAAVSYVLFYRTVEGRQRWHTIGRHGAPWTPDTARAEAKRLLGQVVSGCDPASQKKSKRQAATVSQLCEIYLADAEAGRVLTRRRIAKKLSTLEIDKGRVARHIKPLLGHMKVPAVTRTDIEAFLNDVASGKTAQTLKTKKRGVARVRGGKGAATRAVGLLGAIFAYAVKHGMRSDNPVHGVTRFADGKRERRLHDAEYIALGRGLARAASERMWPPAIAATTCLALSGWRKGEVLGLLWEEVDLERRTATLLDTKTGRSIRPLSRLLCDLLSKQPRYGRHVFPASAGEGAMVGFPKYFRRIRALGNVDVGITPHTLRHSLASLAADLGYSEATIAALLGHQGRTVTSRYVHAADAVLLAAADDVAGHTFRLLKADGVQEHVSNQQPEAQPV